MNQTLTINPTRSLAQFSRRDFIRSALDNTSFNSPIIRTEQLSVDGDEFPLRAADNYLPDSRLGHYATGDRWRRYVSAYITRIEQLIDTMIGSVCNDLSFLQHRNNEYNLRLVETYWEFHCDDPIRLVHQLAPHFRTLGKAGGLVDYSVNNEDENFPIEQFEANSPLLKIAKENNAEIKIYAKTNQRVRFEVERKSGRAPHTFGRLEDMMGLIDTFTEEATDDMTQVISNLNDATGDVIEQQSAYELLNKLLAATDRPAYQRFLASALIMQGGYTKIDGHPVNQVINRLRDDDVIRPVRRRSRTYQLSPHYQQARTILSERWDMILGEDEGS